MRSTRDTKNRHTLSSRACTSTWFLDQQRGLCSSKFPNSNRTNRSGDSPFIDKARFGEKGIFLTFVDDRSMSRERYRLVHLSRSITSIPFESGTGIMELRVRIRFPGSLGRRLRMPVNFGIATLTFQICSGSRREENRPEISSPLHRPKKHGADMPGRPRGRYPIERSTAAARAFARSGPYLFPLIRYLISAREKPCHNGHA